MNALIDPVTPSQYVDHWQDGQPIYFTYDNSCRVCQVSATQFDVALPLFWKECADTVGATTHYYNNTTDSFAPIINAERP